MVELKVTESSRKQEETDILDPAGPLSNATVEIGVGRGRAPYHRTSGMLDVPHLMTNTMEGRKVKEMSRATGRDVVAILRFHGKTDIPRGMIPSIKRERES